MCTMCMQCLGRPAEGIGTPRTGATRHSVGAGTQTWVLCSRSKCFNHWASLQPLMSVSWAHGILLALVSNVVVSYVCAFLQVIRSLVFYTGPSLWLGMSIVTVQLGQCGNQIGFEVFDALFRDSHCSQGLCSKRENEAYQASCKERFFREEENGGRCGPQSSPYPPSLPAH